MRCFMGITNLAYIVPVAKFNKELWYFAHRRITIQVHDDDDD